MRDGCKVERGHQRLLHLVGNAQGKVDGVLFRLVGELKRGSDLLGHVEQVSGALSNRLSRNRLARGRIVVLRRPQVLGNLMRDDSVGLEFGRDGDNLGSGSRGVFGSESNVQGNSDGGRRRRLVGLDDRNLVHGGNSHELHVSSLELGMGLGRVASHLGLLQKTRLEQVGLGVRVVVGDNQNRRRHLSDRRSVMHHGRSSGRRRSRVVGRAGQRTGVGSQTSSNTVRSSRSALEVRGLLLVVDRQNGALDNVMDRSVGSHNVGSGNLERRRQLEVLSVASSSNALLGHIDRQLELKGISVHLVGVESLGFALGRQVGQVGVEVLVNREKTGLVAMGTVFRSGLDVALELQGDGVEGKLMFGGVDDDGTGNNVALSVMSLRLSQLELESRFVMGFGGDDHVVRSSRCKRVDLFVWVDKEEVSRVWSIGRLYSMSNVCVH